MSHLKRRLPRKEVDLNNNSYAADINKDSESEMEPLPSIPSGECSPCSEKKNEVSDVLFESEALKNLSPKWKNLLVRGFFAVVMISSFCFVVYLGK